MQRTPTLTISPPQRRHHGYAFFLFILGTLFPPFAVAARTRTQLLHSGTFHSLKNHRIRLIRTLSRTYETTRTTLEPQNGHKSGVLSTPLKSDVKSGNLSGLIVTRIVCLIQHWKVKPLEEGQVGRSTASISSDGMDDQRNRNQDDGLWRPEDERYYNASNDSNSSGRWHYPANFDDAVVSGGSKKSKKKKEKKDRWARTEDAYSLSEQAAAEEVEEEEETVQDPEGGLYGPGPRRPDEPVNGEAARAKATTTDDVITRLPRNSEDPIDA
ncbi:hypothetical protein VNI00_003364 [Paramarasmius palmivorus]|uniref:Uncharacterized protein n=1 Tax=Paramarasmius palmivorus TaxID=297713 RepID=A0AAW0DPJ0_9AGAR